MMRTAREPRTCPGCHRPMVPSRVAPPPGGVRHAARGLCFTCYSRERVAGTQDRYPRRYRNADERDQLVARYLELRDGSRRLTMAQIAALLGTTRTNLYGLIKHSPVVPPKMSDAELVRLRALVGVS